MFQINGQTWLIKIIDPNNEIFIMDNGMYTIRSLWQPYKDDIFIKSIKR